jgi:hypothetical protein
VNDVELAAWLREGRVVVVGNQLTLFSDMRGSYDPCQAPSWRWCRYCPWTHCDGPLEAPEDLQGRSRDR